MDNTPSDLHKLNVMSIFDPYMVIHLFGPKRDENGEWRRLHNVELHSLYCSPNIVRVIKSRKLRWAGHVSRIEEGRSTFKILIVVLQERDL